MAGAVDLDAEMAAANDYGLGVIDRFRKLGISENVIFGLRSRCGIVQVQTNPDGLYQPHDHGQWMMATPEGEPGDPSGWLALHDSVCFHTSQPGRWWLRRGAVDLLGTAHVEDVRLLGGPLQLYSTPLAWLQAEAIGAVVVDWSFDPHTTLGGIEAIVCDSDVLAERLQRRWRETERRGPMILAGGTRAA